MAGGSSQPSNTTQTTKVELPAWLEGAAQDNFAQAQDIAKQPYTPYTGNQIAGQTPDQLQAAQAIRDMQGQTGAALGSLGAGAAGLGSYQATQVTPQTLAGTDLSAYMNPYTGEVETNALKALESSREQSQNQIGDQFLSSKAFGGSRQALQSAVTDAQVAQKAAETSAQIRAQNFTQAQAAATGDITRNLAAQQANQTAGLNAAGLDLNAYKTAADIYNSGQQANIRDIGLLDTSGGQQQQMQQGQLDLQYQNWLEAQGWDKSQIEWLHQMIGSAPGSGNTSVMSTGNPGGSRASPAMGALGGAISGGATGAMIGGPAAPYTAAIGAVAGGIMGGLSSR
jgi:hypothetical protein